MFGPSGYWTKAYAMLQKFDPFLSLDCAPTPLPWRNPWKGRDQILPSGNLVVRGENGNDDYENNEEEVASSSVATCPLPPAPPPSMLFLEAERGLISVNL